MRDPRVLRIKPVSVAGLLALGIALDLAGCSKSPTDSASSAGPQGQDGAEKAAPLTTTGADTPRRALSPKDELASITRGATAQPVAAPPEPECFTETYKHPKADGHGRASDCLNHQNLIRFAREARDARSVCVRVDGTPVRFKTLSGAKGKGIAGVVFGPIAGPETVVSVRYCTRKGTCVEPNGARAIDDCKIPKDEFLAAIGGDDGEEEAPSGKSARVAQWDPADTDEGDISDEVDRELRKELHGDPDVKPFEGWKSGGATPACAQGKG